MSDGGANEETETRHLSIKKILQSIRNRRFWKEKTLERETHTQRHTQALTFSPPPPTLPEIFRLCN